MTENLSSHPLPYNSKLNIVSKGLPRVFRTVDVEANPGTPEWRDLLRAEQFTTKQGETIYRTNWGW